MNDDSTTSTPSTTAVFARPVAGDARALLEKMDALTEPMPAERSDAVQAPEAPRQEPVPAAYFKRRHWGLAASFIILVLAPVIVAAWYMWTSAQDQFASTTAFTVRAEEGPRASDLLGGLTAITGGSAAGDSDILFKFIQSQGLVQQIDEDLDLVGHYSSVYDVDPVFGLVPDASREDLTGYWARIVRVSHDAAAGLIEVQVRAFDAQMAHDIAADIVLRSQDMINDLNAQARADALRFAQADLDESIVKMSASRAALSAFRSQAQILDPEIDIQGRMGVLTNLQQQLAQALIDFDLLLQTTSPGDPRLLQEQQRIDVIRARLQSERSEIVNRDASDPDGQDFPTLISEYEALSVEREFAEQSYRLALAALDTARDDVARKSRYLATFINPAVAETPEYPRREVILGLVGLFSFLSWAVGCLIFYSIRDRG